MVDPTGGATAKLHQSQQGTCRACSALNGCGWTRKQSKAALTSARRRRRTQSPH